MITGTPPSSRNCFGRSPPSRVPLPAATTMATFIRLCFGVANARQCRRCLHFSQGSPGALAVSRSFSLLSQASKDHFSGGCLEHARHRDVSILSDQSPRVVDHDHRAVIKIRDTLVV